MDIQDLFSILIFAAFIAFRYFMKSKQDKGKTGKRRSDSERTGDRGVKEKTSPEEEKKSPFEDFFEELEKEFSPQENKPEQQQSPSNSTQENTEVFSPSEDPEFLKKQEEMQRAAETEYAKTQSGLNLGESERILKPVTKRRKKKTPFNPRKAYMYKELLDRKHFDV